MNFNKLTQGEKIVLVAGILLVLDLLLLPWHRVEGSLLGTQVDVAVTGTESPNGGYGVFAVLLTLVMVLQIMGAKFTKAQMPQPAIGWPKVHLYLGCGVMIVILLKLFAETDSLSTGAYLGILLAGAVAYGGFLISKASSLPGYP